MSCVAASSFLVLGWENGSAADPGTVAVEYASVRDEIPLPVRPLYFGHSVDPFLWQGRSVRFLVPDLMGYTAHYLYLLAFRVLSFEMSLLKVCTCLHLGLLFLYFSEGVKEVG